MKLNRFYFNIEDKNGDKIVLKEDEFRHAVLVMRTKVGDSICLFCGDGFDYIVTVTEILKKEAICTIIKVEKNDIEPACKLTVFQALAKGDKLNLITQKLTEIGVSNLEFFVSKFCDVKENTTKLNKLTGVVVAASKQCGRSKTLKINEQILNIKEICKQIGKFDAVYFAYENATKTTLAKELAKQKGKNIALIIGAEGGFSLEEAQQLIDSGAIEVSLGKRIMRTETCSIVASSLIIQTLED